MLARPIALLIAILPAFACAQDATALVTVPALTPVAVRLEELISSNKNRPGDRFRITVAEDVRVGDALVIPAGSPGEGEVIHAAKSGAGGKAGELILAARYVRVGDIEVRLRSFALGVVGKDQAANSLAASMISREKRSHDTSAESSGDSIFTTTFRRSTRSSATTTRDIPPPPSSRSRS